MAKDSVGVEEGEFKCPSCGAQLAYSASKGCLACEHCGYVEKVVSSSDVSERDFKELVVKTSSNLKSIKCDNCGAVELLANNEIATKCPFCGSVAIVDLNQLDTVQPDSLIPFKVERAEASQTCTKWLKARFFSPNKFKKTATVDNIKGVYYPIWTFDSQTVTNYSGQLGEHYTETYTSDGKTYTRQKIRWFNVSGARDDAFDDIFIRGSTLIAEKYLQEIQPFNKDEYVKYNDDFLAGYVANNYTVDPYEAFYQAEALMEEHIKQEIVSDYGADTIGTLNLSISHVKKSFKYLLIPIYITASSYKSKLYNQYINGVNGNVGGKAPISPVKVSIAVLLGLGLIGLIAYLMIGKEGAQAMVEQAAQVLKLL